MIQTLSPDLKKAQDIAGTAHVLAIIALVGIVVTIVVNGGFPIGSILFNNDLPWRERLNEAGLILIALLPAFFFYEAVNQLRKALDHYCDGEFFSEAASRCVAKSGDYALEAMVAVILIVPNLTLWVSEGGGGFDIDIEPETIGMLAFALFVSAVGRILTAATQLKAENDAFV